MNRGTLYRNTSKWLLPFLCILWILLLLFFSKSAVSSAQKGIHLWLNIVFPALFPFLVISELLNGTGFIKALGVLLEPLMRPLFNVPGCGSFALAMGLSSGYPMGAKITAQLRKEKLISKTEGERLLAFTNNSGPLFIIGAISTGIFHMEYLGFFMLVCHMASGLSVGLIFKYYKYKDDHIAPKNQKNKLHMSKKIKQALASSVAPPTHFGLTLRNAMHHSLITIVTIGGYIILFSVMIALLLDTGIIDALTQRVQALLHPFGISDTLIQSMLCGFFEITSGVNLTVMAQDSLSIKIIVCSMIVGWAGLSVHSQVIGIVSDTDLSVRGYLMGKLLQGILAGLYTLAGLKVFGTKLLGASTVFASTPSVPSLKWHDYFLISSKSLFICLALLIFMGFLIRRYKRYR